MTNYTSDGVAAVSERDSALETLKRIPRILAAEGYSDAFTSYGILNARADVWAQDLHLLPDNVRTLFELFLLGRAVPAERLAGIFTSSELEALEHFSILVGGPSSFHTGGLALIPAHGYLLLTQRPNVNPMIYFGADSAALAAHLMPPAGAECLDLCAGPGIQAMICSGPAKHVVAVEINPLAASYAELNVVMNDLEGRVEVRNGDLFKAVPGIEFDFICANPPLLPFPPELPYPFVGHGGADGIEVTRKILHGLPGALRPGGLCQIIGTCVGNEEGPLCEEELREFAFRENFQVRMTVPTALPLGPDSHMFSGLVWSCATAAGLDAEEVAARFRSHLNQLGATRLNLFFLTVCKSERDPAFSITRQYRERDGFWFI